MTHAEWHKCDPLARQRLEELQPDEEMTLLLQCRKPAGSAEYEQFVQHVTACGCEIVTRLELIGAVAAKLPARAVAELLRHENVHKVWLDRTYYALLDHAVPAVGITREWNSPYTGKGVTIAVLDTGVYPHPDLITPANRIVAFHDLVNGRSEPYDDNGHGTHVAGCALGNGHASGGKYRGPAPEAFLAAVKVLNEKGHGSMSGVIAGIEWCLKKQDELGIRVLSLSLGTPHTGVSYRDDPVCQALEKAWKAGMIVVVAAGNAGPNPRTITSPGIHPLLITVGASDDRDTDTLDDDRIPSFSSRGPTKEELAKPDIVAPGTNIVSLRSPGSSMDRMFPERRVEESYFVMSGTSMAAPICSGIAALLIQSRPEAGPDEIKRAMMEGARDIFHDRLAAGFGCIDVPQALASLNGGQAPTPRPQPSPAEIAWGMGVKETALALISSAAREIRVHSPVISDVDAILALAEAAGRSVSVRVLLEEAGGEGRRLARFLAGRGIEVRVAPAEPESRDVGLSTALFDGKRLLAANGAWSFGGLGGDDAFAVLTGDSVQVEFANRRWEARWERAAEEPEKLTAGSGR